MSECAACDHPPSMKGPVLTEAEIRAIPELPREIQMIYLRAINTFAQVRDGHHALNAAIARELTEARVKLDIERLAEAEHEQWMRWAKALLEFEPGISPARRERWQRLFVPYGDRPEELKELDRAEARRALEPKPSRGAP